MKLFTVLLTLIVTAGPSLPMNADDTSPRKLLETAYSTYDKAAAEGIPGVHKWCEENLGPEFSMVFLDGNTLSRQQYLDMMQRLIANPGPGWKDVKSQKSRIKKLEMQGQDAVVQVEIATTYLTKNPKRKEIVLERPYRETWTKVGEVWKVKRCEEMEPKSAAPDKSGANKSKRPDFPTPRGNSPAGTVPVRRPGYP